MSAKDCSIRAGRPDAPCDEAQRLAGGFMVTLSILSVLGWGRGEADIHCDVGAARTEPEREAASKG